MPSITKSLPVVLLVSASALAGPIVRDQNGNNGDHGECIKECCLSNGLELCRLDWQQIFDPKSDYCPADIDNHEEFMRYAHTCWKAMNPDDHSHDNGEDCLGHVDLCPLLPHYGPGGDDQPWNPLDPNSGAPHGGPGVPPLVTGQPGGPQMPPPPHGGPGGQPGQPIGIPPIVIGGNGQPRPMPPSGQDCPDLGLCPLVHDLLSGDGPQGSHPSVGAPGSGSLPPPAGGNGPLPPSSGSGAWWWNGNGQSGDSQLSRPFYGNSDGASDSNSRLPLSRPDGNNGDRLDGNVDLHNGDSSSNQRPVGDSNDRPRIGTPSSTDHTGPFAYVDGHSQNDPQDHRVNIIGNDDDSSRNHNNGNDLDVHAGDDSDHSRQSQVDPVSSIPARPSGSNDQHDGQQDSQHDGQQGIDVNVHNGEEQGHSSQSGEQNGLHIVDGESRGPRNNAGENGECQQK